MHVWMYAYLSTYIIYLSPLYPHLYVWYCGILFKTYLFTLQPSYPCNALFVEPCWTHVASVSRLEVCSVTPKKTCNISSRMQHSFTKRNLFQCCNMLWWRHCLLVSRTYHFEDVALLQTIISFRTDTSHHHYATLLASKRLSTNLKRSQKHVLLFIGSWVTSIALFQPNIS